MADSQIDSKTNTFNRRSMLKALTGLTVGGYIGSKVLGKEELPDAEILAIWNDFKEIYSDRSVYPKKGELDVRQIWRKVEPIKPVSIQGSAAKAVMAAPMCSIANEWLAGEDVTNKVGYYSPAYKLAREQAEVSGLDLNGLHSPCRAI